MAMVVVGLASVVVGAIVVVGMSGVVSWAVTVAIKAATNTNDHLSAILTSHLWRHKSYSQLFKRELGFQHAHNVNAIEYGDV